MSLDILLDIDPRKTRLLRLYFGHINMFDLSGIKPKEFFDWLNGCNLDEGIQYSGEFIQPIQAIKLTIGATSDRYVNLIIEYLPDSPQVKRIKKGIEELQNVWTKRPKRTVNTK